MKINIVTETPGWILHRFASELKNRLPLTETDSLTVNGWIPGDVNYYLHYAKFRDSDTGVKIGFFTHEENSKFKTIAQKCDGHVCMNERVRQCLLGYGAPNPVIIKPGVSSTKPITFGIVGRTYSTGRKNAEFARLMKSNGYRVRAWGSGWPCEIAGDIPTAEDWAIMDYLVVTSLNEGGPVPVLEAIAHGVPVIAPDVGWCWEYPVIQYECGNWESLSSVLHRLTSLPTWSQWATAHWFYFLSVQERIT